MVSSGPSQLGLRIRLPNTSDFITFQTTDSQLGSGAEWQHPAETLSDGLQTKAVWRQVRNRWPDRKQILLDTGAQLAAWLFDQRAADYLDALARSKPETPWRVELRVPREWTEWPWETLQTAATGPLAIHPALTLVRGNANGSSAPDPVQQLSLDLVAVDLEGDAKWPEIETARELERIRGAIEGADAAHRLSTRSDPLGRWEGLVERYEDDGPPQVFHFAGHGLDHGKGLVFRDNKGGSRKVLADELAALLGTARSDRRCHLVYLNACSGAAAGTGRYQPFGSLAELLIERHIPMVIAFQGAVEDAPASQLAVEFYHRVVEGMAVDRALQEARRAVYLRGTDVAWAFATLMVAGTPQPLVRIAGSLGPGRASASIQEFAHEGQRTRLRRFLHRDQPLVVVIHGDLGRGHDHVAQRVQHDLEQEGRALWRPVSAMHWFVAGEPLASEMQLLAGVARALSVDDAGATDDLKNRIARVLAERCAADQTVVIELVETVTLEDEPQAKALGQLVRQLWVDLVRRARARTRNLPVFLILKVGYLRSRPKSDRGHLRVEEQRKRAQATVEAFAEKRRLQERIRVEVLEALEPISEEDVADFLEEVLEIDPDRAEHKARHLVGLADNDTIIERMKRLLSEWGTS